MRSSVLRLVITGSVVVYVICTALLAFPPTHQRPIAAQDRFPVAGTPTVEVGQLGDTVYLPLITSFLQGQVPTPGPPSPPPPTFSYYMGTVDADRLRALGEAIGAEHREQPGAEQAIIIFFYGQLTYIDSDQGREYLAFDFANRLITLDQIRVAMQQFGRSYRIALGVNNDAERTRLIVTVGTSNDEDPTVTDDNMSVTSGQAWADMINDIERWYRITTIPITISPQVRAAGGFDLEPGFNAPGPTERWIIGYEFNADGRELINFGSADGCPFEGDGASDRPCSVAAYPGWTQNDLRRMSNNSLILPQIYLTDGSQSQQWYQLQLYTVVAGEIPLSIVGVTNQAQACVEIPEQCADGTDNTPTESWDQLWTALNADPRTTRRLFFITNFTWRQSNPSPDETFR